MGVRINRHGIVDHGYLDNKVVRAEAAGNNNVVFRRERINKLRTSI